MTDSYEIKNSVIECLKIIETKLIKKTDENRIAYLNYEFFRVIGANDSVENYADLFTTGLRNDDTQEFDSKCDGILLSMTKIPPERIVQIKNTRV